MRTLLIAFAFVLAAAVPAAHAQAPAVDAGLNEAVVRVPKPGLFNIELETTMYKPDGEGPFPVALINHGKAPGDPRFQGRYRPARAARYFLQRGYAVVVPMRQGFANSGGVYVGAGCNIESNGRVQAENVKTVLEWLRSQTWADMEHIIVMGQSHGGWTTLAFGTLKYPGVKGLVNFAGGLRQEGCLEWRHQLATAVASYARETTVPSIWFYGDNDSYFDPPTWQAMHTQYREAGGQAQLVAFGKFGSDAHAMFNSSAGTSIWEPEVTRFLRTVGLPSERSAAYLKFGTKTPMPVPPATDFAPVADEARVPYLKERGREGYKTYLGREHPRAFALSTEGAWGWAHGGDDPLQRALDNCNKQQKGACRLYSVDDAVVWMGEKTRDLP